MTKTTRTPITTAIRFRLMISSSFDVCARVRACDQLRAEAHEGGRSALGERSTRRGPEDPGSTGVDPDGDRNPRREELTRDACERDANLGDRGLNASQQPPQARRGHQR